MLGTGLGLSAAFCWGISDFLAGRQSRSISVLVVLVGSQTIGLCGLAAMLAITAPGAPSASLLVLAPLAGITGALGLASFYRALAVGSMSLVAPITASGVTVPVLVGVLRGDELGVVTASGVMLAIGGVIFASRAGAEPESIAGERSGLSKRAAGLSITAALSMGVSLTLLGVSAEHGVPWTLVLARCAAVSAGLVTLLVARPAIPRPRMLVPVVVVGVLETLATGVYTLATTKGLLSLTAVAASLYPVVTVLLARGFLHERLNRAQAVGVFAVLLGVVLMAAG